MTHPSDALPMPDLIEHPHTFSWTTAERRCIEEYARGARREAWDAAAALAMRLDQEHGFTPQPPAQTLKDAERYRWLRSTTNWASSNGERVDVRDNPDRWDSAIDAAIAQEAKK